MSLNPSSRLDEVADVGLWDGLMSGFCAAIPSGLGVWYGSTRSPTFMKLTNYSSRTALFIMPPLFTFALSSEQKITQRMREMAEEKDHTNRVSEWAEDQEQQQLIKRQAEIRKTNTKRYYEQMKGADGTTSISSEERERQLAEIYRLSVEQSGVRIVPGDRLGVHHRIANFWQENPFKVLTAVSVPTIFYIFKGKSTQAHLQLQSMIMHTRVYGQFSVIIMLLSLMGFKGYMDVYGKFVTEMDAQKQVDAIKVARQSLLDRLEMDKENEVRIKKLKKRAKEEMEEEKAMKKSLKKGKKKKAKEIDITLENK